MASAQIKHIDKKLLDPLNSMKVEASEELKRILAFWSQEVYQDETNSFIGRIKQDGEKFPEADLGAVLISRILWTFSAAYKVDRSEQHKRVADAAYELIVESFWDKEYGGLYWSIDHTGQVAQSRKQAYAQGFGIYGLSEYYSAFGNSDALKRAHDLYSLLEEKFYDSRFGGYMEALDRNWSEIEDLRLSEKDANAPKTMNTHLHILEPYSNLYRIDPSTDLKLSLTKLIDLFLERIINPETGHFDLFFDRDWSRQSKIDSYGHDIEGAWLLSEAAQLTGDPNRIRKVEKVSIKLVEVTRREGTDEDGSLFYETEQGVLDTDKHWWPQAEALVGYLDAFEITGESMYLVECLRIWDFIKDKLLDRDKGEWFWRVDQGGNAPNKEDKVGFWKCPYHNSRALMESVRRIEQITKQND